MAAIITKPEPVVWSFLYDIKHKSFGDWLAAHTSFMLPLHHYEGTVAITKEFLVLSGKRKESPESAGSGAIVDIKIPKDAIEKINHGFDENFGRFQDRSMGITGFKPMRITLKKKAMETVVPEKVYELTALHSKIKISDLPREEFADIYIAVGFDNFTRRTNNDHWKQSIEDWQSGSVESLH